MISTGALVKYRRGKSGYDAKNEAGQLEPRRKSVLSDYNGGMYGVLLAALSAYGGVSKLRFPRSRKTRDELELITVVVGKEELVDAGPGKQLMAWPIDTEGNYANKSHSIFWVTKEAPYVIKLVTTIPTGKWVTVTISMI